MRYLPLLLASSSLLLFLACAPKVETARPIPARVPIPGPFDAAAPMVASGSIIAEGNSSVGPTTLASAEMKNVTVMADVPIERFMAAMLAMKGAIGAECKECHPVEHFESDEVRAKLKTRQMIKMSVEIDELFFERQARVTCFMCHHGKWTPEQDPPLKERIRAAKHPVPSLTEEESAKPAEKVFRRVQSFKGKPAAEMMSAMSSWTAAIGVDCTYCHTEEGKWDAEDVVQKDVTRAMVAMTDRINGTWFAGEPVVTCWGCHRGMPIPERTAPDATP